METLFENNDFILCSTGHDYDFVGTIEVKRNESMYFFFSEDWVLPNDKEDDEYEREDYIIEDETKLLKVFYGLSESGTEEIGKICSLGADSALFVESGDSAGFLSCPLERGWFLALIKAYCPEKQKEIPWA